MSETELSVVCKSCGSEVSPYVTECPYCGARLRKRAPKLERRGDALEARRVGRRRRGRRLFAGRGGAAAGRPYATLAILAASAALLIAGKVAGSSLDGIGGAVAPLDGEWWRVASAPFAYVDAGYLFVVGLGLAIFGPLLERRLGSGATLVLLGGCGILGTLAATGIVSAFDRTDLFGGGNGMALGALGAWLVLRRAEARRQVADGYDPIAVAVAAAVLLALPIFDWSANVFAGLVGGAVGVVAGALAAALRPTTD